MNNLLIEKTISTPYIDFNYESGKLTVTGESFPENAIKFYDPAIIWIKEYLEKTDSRSIQIDFEIIYFNSSTSKIYMMFFNLLDEAAKNGKSILVNWRVSQENETIIECGEEFMEDLEFVEFKIVYI